MPIMPPAKAGQKRFLNLGLTKLKKANLKLADGTPIQVAENLKILG